MRAEIQTLRAETQAEFQAVRAEMREEFKIQREDINGLLGRMAHLEGLREAITGRRVAAAEDPGQPGNAISQPYRKSCSKALRRSGESVGGLFKPC